MKFRMVNRTIVKDYDLDYHLKKIKDENVLNRVNELRENILKISEFIIEYYNKDHIMFKMDNPFCRIDCQQKQFWVYIKLNEKEMMAENLYKDLDIRPHKDEIWTHIRIHDGTNLNLILNLVEKSL